MPHATQAYPFEGKVFEFAGTLAATLAGGHCSFLILLDEQGVVRSLTFERPDPSWHEVIGQLTAAGQQHLLRGTNTSPRCSRTSQRTTVSATGGKTDIDPARIPLSRKLGNALPALGTAS